MGLAHSPRIVTDGLVLCLDAANKKSYPGSGTTWNDLSGRGNHCTLTNGPTFSSSFGGMISTDGVDDFIVTPALTGTGTGTFSQSYCLWVRPDDTDGNILSMAATNPQGGWNMPPIAASSSTFRGKFWNNQYLYGKSTYVTGTWYYVCLIFSYNATTANAYQRLYVNGIMNAEQTNVSYSSSGTNNFVFFGQQNPGADNTGMFKGDYGAIQLYTSKALTDSEILQNFNALRGRYGI